MAHQRSRAAQPSRSGKHLRLGASAAASGDFGTIERPLNNSKGCGGVMRAAPAGFWSTDPGEVFRLGCGVAALTHGHPSGYLSAGVLAAMVCRLFAGCDLVEALAAAEGELRRWPGHDETVQALDAARRLAAGAGSLTPEALETLGGGWTGEEALAIAVFAALVGDRLADGLLLAVNHSGDSDSTGAICGNLLGARLGSDEIPSQWLQKLELREVIETLAADAAQEFFERDAGEGRTAPDDRYPRR